MRQRNYQNNANKEIKNPGWISIDKLQNIMRLYYTNLHGLGFDSTEKLI